MTRSHGPWPKGFEVHAYLLQGNCGEHFVEKAEDSCCVIVENQVLLYVDTLLLKNLSWASDGVLSRCFFLCSAGMFCKDFGIGLISSFGNYKDFVAESVFSPCIECLNRESMVEKLSRFEHVT